MLVLTYSSLQKLSQKITFKDLPVMINSETAFDVSTPNDLFQLQKKFRIKVIGGGCSGYQYKFFIDEEQNDDDLILSAPQVNYELIIDQHSLPLIKGSVLDYHISLSGEYFVLKNPNAKIKCGCGNSFST